MNILAIGAHPDDVEIQCAGTLHKYKMQGHHITIAVVSNGDMGHMHIAPKELAAIRKSEALASAALIGADVAWFDIGGPTIQEDESTRKRFIEVLRKAEPDVVITHHPDDYHDNHRQVSRLVRETLFQASIPHIRTESKALHATPALFYMDNFSGLGFVPTHFIDITESIEIKSQMLGAHQSQKLWLMEHSGLDIEDMMRTTAKYRGYQSGVPFAEAFSFVPSFPLVLPGTLLPV